LVFKKTFFFFFPFIPTLFPDSLSLHNHIGKRKNPTIEEWITKGVNEALTETKVPAKMIDRSYIGNFVGECFVSQGHLGSGKYE